MKSQNKTEKNYDTDDDDDDKLTGLGMSARVVLSRTVMN
jgi:hypothetical protein